MDSSHEAAPSPSHSGQSTPALPVVPTSFVGRQVDAERIIDLLVTCRSRTVTIAGPSGVGKTRLALHVATRLARAFDNGVTFVPLAGVGSAEFVIPTILKHLGVQDPRPAPPGEQLCEALAGRQMLLVLDNMEHLLSCAADLGAVMMCEGVQMLVTSQAPLGVRGEQMYPLAPLRLPGQGASVDQIHASDAVTLFIERARAVNPHLVIDERNAAIVPDLCHHLDGLPLAIELAAARSGILDPRAILERLDRRFSVLTGGGADVPERMRTLRNAIGWSYDLLDASEQRMWRWLSIFSGGISLEAIEAFPATDESGARSSLDILSQLVSRSLLRTVMIPGVSPRYVMLESLRAFGVDQLLATGEEIDARTWHAQWFASVVAATAPHYADAGQLAMLDTFSLEWDNIRQALTWFREREEVGSILALCSQLWRFWSMRGMATEGRKWAADALAASATEITPRRAETCIAAAYLAEDQNDLDEAERFLYAALAIFEQLGDRARVAATLSGLGSVAHDRRDYPKALEWHRRAVEAAEASGDPRTRAVALGNLGGASYLQGNYHLARSCCEQAVVILGELGDQHGEAILLSNLGAQLLELDDLVAARDVLERALVLVRGIGDLKSIGCNLINLAEVYFRDDDGETALPMLAEARELLRQTGNNGDAAIGQIALTRVLLERGDVRLALSTIRESLVVFREVEDFASAAEATELLARIAVTIGAMAEARTLFANADLLRDVVRAPMRPSLVAETMQAKQRVPDLPGSIVRGTGPAETLPRTPQGIMATVCQLADILERRVTARTGEVGGRSSDERVDRGPAATVPPGDLAPAAFAARRYALSSRELEVLRLLAEGKSTRTIADELFISPRTVATHVTNILGKLEVNSRAAAVAMSLRLHLV